MLLRLSQTRSQKLALAVGLLLLTAQTAALQHLDCEHDHEQGEASCSLCASTLQDDGPLAPAAVETVRPEMPALAPRREALELLPCTCHTARARAPPLRSL